MAETSELTAESTTEDIAAHVEQVVEEVKQERAGEPEQKGDAQITSEHASTPQPADKTHAETESGSETAPTGEDTAEVEDQGEITGEEGPSWLDDDLKAETAAYGIDESEIADFDSREELERALRLFDKTALEAGRKAMAESEGEQKAPTRGDDGRFQKKDPEPEAKEEETERQSPEGKYEITLENEELWDEDVAAGVKKVASGLLDHFESRIAAFESRFAEADARAEEQHFDSLVDKLGHADLFGKTENETPKQLQRRKDLMVAVKAQQIGLEQLGRPTDLTESLISRVARMVFTTELGKKDLKNHTRKITRQSNGRQGGGATRPQDPREDPRDAADRLYRELERV